MDFQGRPTPAETAAAAAGPAGPQPTETAAQEEPAPLPEVPLRTVAAAAVQGGKALWDLVARVAVVMEPITLEMGKMDKPTPVAGVEGLAMAPLAATEVQAS